MSSEEDAQRIKHLERSVNDLTRVVIMMSSFLKGTPEFEGWGMTAIIDEFLALAEYAKIDDEFGSVLDKLGRM